MRELRIGKEHADEMVEHCMGGRPNEACGMLGLEGSRVVKVFNMKNTEASPLRYRLDSLQQLAASQAIEGAGWDYAVYHSHTRTEAYPSPTDVKDAVDEVPYVIVSLASDPVSIRAFWLIKEDYRDETGEIREIPVTVE